ncbi:SDR family oxidoreductase [bacterium]
MRIGVTSASGRLGAAIVRQLIKLFDNDKVVAIARTPEKAKYLGVEIRKADYNLKSQFDETLADIDTVLLVSGMNAPDKRIQQHRNVINAAKDVGVRKIVYTSIVGNKKGSTFSPIIASNRQTEEDIKSSGLNWSIGRNGLYIEPDVEYLDRYIKEGKIANCAGQGSCAYTIREELGYAYSKMLLEDKHNGKIYNLVGEAITQRQLTDYFNKTFKLKLVYESLSVEEYQANRTAELGEFLGKIIAGIYSSIRNGDLNVKSDFREAAGREHMKWADYFKFIGED